MAFTSARQAAPPPRASLLPEAADLHQQIVGSLAHPRPAWLRSASLLDHQWTVSTQGMRFKEETSLVLNFASTIAPRRTLLTDPLHECDLVTAKVVAYHLLRRNFEGPTVYTLLLALFWFFRWRLDRGIYATSDLTPAFFEDFVRSLARGGRLALIDFAPRVRALQVRAEEGEPLAFLQSHAGDRYVKVDLVAAELGVQDGLSLPRPARRDVLLLLQQHGLRLHPHTLQWLANPKVASPIRGIGAMQPLLQIWAYLWEYQGYLLHDPLPFDPFGDVKLSKRLASIGRASKRTATIPVKQGSYLLDRSLRWVTDYSPEILRLLREAKPALEHRRLETRKPAYRRVIASAHFRGPAKPSIYPDSFGMLPTASPNGVATLRTTAFHFLATACAIVIAAFTARRKEEVEQLREESLKRDDAGRDWLEVWVQKTLRDYATISAPASVRQAIDVLKALSAEARRSSRSTRLFQFADVQTGAVHKFHFARYLVEFSTFCDIPPLPDGSAWHFKPHQLRRFFAVSYYHAFKYSSLTALTIFLKHFQPSMTRRYVTEDVPGEYEELNAASVASRTKRGRPWHQMLSPLPGVAVARARRDLAFLPADFESVVSAAQRHVDVLSPRARPTRDSLNHLLLSINVPKARPSGRRRRS